MNDNHREPIRGFDVVFPLPTIQLGTRHGSETVMNWDRIEGNWKEYSGKAKQQWGKLTDDDMTAVEGRREELEGRLQNRYGYAKDKVKAEVDSWLGRI
jgi:uncharacterized protein YjbJ (UPF0337 family)